MLCFLIYRFISLHFCDFWGVVLDFGAMVYFFARAYVMRATVWHVVVHVQYGLRLPTRRVQNRSAGPHLLAFSAVLPFEFLGRLG